MKTDNDILLNEKIANILICAKIPPKILGYRFLREAVKMTISNPSLINGITKKLYPEIARRFETSAGSVERAIRHAIEVAYNRGGVTNINSIFGLHIYEKTDKPSNAELIALIADKIFLQII